MIAKHLILIMALLLSMIPGVDEALCPQSDFGEDEVTEYPDEAVYGLTEYTWSLPESGPVARGADALEFSRAGRVSRLLVESQDGTRLVLTDTVLPRSGRHLLRMADDETGWWLEVELRYGRTWRGARTYNLFVEEEFGPHCGALLRQEARTSTGAATVVEASLGEDSLVHVHRLLEEDELVRDLRQHVPDGIRGLVAQLSENAENPYAAGVVYKGLLRLVQMATATAEGPALQRWVANTQPHRNGPPPDLIELLSRFKGVGNTDPLDGHRLRDVLDKDPGSG